MSKQAWQATVMVAGSGSGRPLLLTEPLSLWGGLDPRNGKIIDRRHPQMGETVTGRVLILPAGRGSSSASAILLEAIKAQTAPVAIITAEADIILTLGAVVAQEIYATAPPVVVLSNGDYGELETAVSEMPTAQILVENKSVTFVNRQS